MPQQPKPGLSTHNKKGRGVARRFLEMAFVAGMKLDKIDPERKGFTNYQEPNKFPRQEVPTDLDVAAELEDGSSEQGGGEAKNSDLRPPFSPEGHSHFFRR
jgi:hypothetical protein